MQLQMLDAVGNCQQISSKPEATLACSGTQGIATRLPPVQLL